MTAALFITCASSFAAEPQPVAHGAWLAAPRTATLRAEAGMAAALPTVLFGGATGLSPSVDLGAHAVTHAGLAYAMGATVRWRFSRSAGVGLTIDESLYTVENLAGIESLRSPFGNRTAATVSALGATTTGSGVALGYGAGVEVGVVRIVAGTGNDPARRVLRPAVDNAWAQIAASWPRRRGRFFVRVRAIVPVATEFHLLGYLPHVAFGRSWGIR